MMFGVGGKPTHKVLYVRDELAGRRTFLANERTFMAAIRTALSLLAAGLALIRFFPLSPWLEIGWVMLAGSAIILFFGIYNYIKTRHMIYLETGLTPGEIGKIHEQDQKKHKE